MTAYISPSTPRERFAPRSLWTVLGRVPCVEHHAPTDGERAEAALRQLPVIIVRFEPDETGPLLKFGEIEPAPVALQCAILQRLERSAIHRQFD